MTLNGVVDAAVNGGVEMYRTMINGKFREENPEIAEVYNKLHPAARSHDFLTLCCPVLRTLTLAMTRNFFQDNSRSRYGDRWLFSRQACKCTKPKCVEISSPPFRPLGSPGFAPFHPGVRCNEAARRSYGDQLREAERSAQGHSGSSGRIIKRTPHIDFHAIASPSSVAHAPWHRARPQRSIEE